VKNITVALDDEIYRRARIHAAEMGTSVSALVKRLFTETSSVKGDVAAGVPELAAELPAPIRVKPRTPPEVPQREGRDERSAVLRAARAALLTRLQSEPVVDVGRWSRDELYGDQR
jgi:plasmid stability protein